MSETNSSAEEGGIRLLYALGSDGEPEIRPFAFAKVEAVLGNGNIISCHIDQETGDVQIAEHHLFGGITSKKEADGRAPNLVHSFKVSIGHLEDESVVVGQRAGETLQYKETRSRTLRGVGGTIREHRMRPTNVAYFERTDNELREGVRRFGVRTDPMHHGAPNRFDLWIVRFDEASRFCWLSLQVLYIITLDDGKSFKLVTQQRWTGAVQRRAVGSTYALRNNDRRAQETFRNPKVREILNELVFPPGEHCEDFSARMQILEDPRMRALLESSKSRLRTYSGSEDFWVEPPLRTGLMEGQGSVKFLTYGHGNGSFGIIQLPKPIEFHGQQVSSLQFDHRAVTNHSLMDGQGIYTILPGTLCTYENLHWMGLKPGSDDPYPPMAGRVTILYEPVP